MIPIQQMPIKREMMSSVRLKVIVSGCCHLLFIVAIGISLMWQSTSCGMKKQFPFATSATIDFRRVRRRFQSFVARRNHFPGKRSSNGV
jgi:hypothetical protein